MEDFKIAKEWITASIIADELLSKHPCLVKHIVLWAAGRGTKLAYFYDGLSTSSQAKIACRNISWMSSSKAFNIPVYFSKGLYVAFGSASHILTIQYKEEGI